jgi:hypothetical protein
MARTGCNKIVLALDKIETSLACAVFCACFPTFAVMVLVLDTYHIILRLVFFFCDSVNLCTHSVRSQYYSYPDESAVFGSGARLASSFILLHPARTAIILTVEKSKQPSNKKR